MKQLYSNKDVKKKKKKKLEAKENQGFKEPERRDGEMMNLVESCEQFL